MRKRKRRFHKRRSCASMLIENVNDIHPAKSGSYSSITKSRNVMEPAKGGGAGCTTIIESLGFASMNVSPRLPQWRLQLSALCLFPHVVSRRNSPSSELPFGRGNFLSRTDFSSQCRPPAICSSRVGKPWRSGHISCGRFYGLRPSNAHAGPN
jgi:hypothetical protein